MYGIGILSAAVYGQLTTLIHCVLLMVILMRITFLIM
jgi:hypothetical protein